MSIIFTINARSISNKIEPFQQHIIEADVLACAIRETWLRQQNLENNMIREIKPTGYDIISHPRIDGHQREGGVALIYKSSLNVKDKTDQ